MFSEHFHHIILHMMPLLYIRTCMMEKLQIEQHSSCIYGACLKELLQFSEILICPCFRVRLLVNRHNRHIFVYWANITSMIMLSFDIAFLRVKLKLTYCVSSIFVTFCTLFPHLWPIHVHCYLYRNSLQLWSYILTCFILLCTQDC
jgi:hypothetical protein